MDNNLSENNLFHEIGIQLVKNQETGLPISPKQLIERGKKWFESKKEELQESVCTNEYISKLVNDNTQEKAVIVAIADLITSICIGVSPITVAALLSKYGIEKFCFTHWDKSNLNAE